MRLFSTAALSLALVATAGLALPAHAAKKDEKKEEAQSEGAKLTLSPAYGKAINPAQNALKANNFAEAKPLIDAAAATVTSPDDDYHYGLVLLQYSVGSQDKATQKAALERLVKNDRTPVNDRASYEQVLGQTYLIEDRNFAAAQQALQAAIDHGVVNAATFYQLAEAKFGQAVENSGGATINEANKPLALAGLADLQRATEIPMPDGSATPVSFFDRGFKIARAASPETMLSWGNRLLKAAPTRENWKLVLLTVYDAHRDITRAESLDLFRLMLTTNAMSDAGDYNAYAEVAWKLGLPGEVKDLYDAGKTRGVITDSDLSELYKLASDGIAKDRSSLTSSVTAATNATDGKSVAATANAFIGYNDYAKAVELFRTAQAKGGAEPNEVATRLGIALARSGDNAGALAAFETVKGPGVRRDIADLWQIWLNNPTAS